MMKRIILLLIGFSFLLVGCGGGSADTAVQYLEALNQRDLETARGLVCEARQDDVTMGLTTVDDLEVEPFTFTNVSCSPQGSGIMCRFTVEQETQAAETTGIQQTRQVVFEFDGDKICGFEEQVAE